MKSYFLVKRALGLVLSVLAIVLLSPVLLIICLCIKADSRGPILFKQKRIGRYKREFYIYKFRTMRTDTPKDQPTHLLENPQAYITRTGRLLRKSSLDELPQIFNILKGEMSFIGPRPALWNQTDLIAERDKYNANDVPPGLTGWAQINGRDELPILFKARLDGFYTSNIGLLMDVKIFFKTIGHIFKADGVVEGKATESAQIEYEKI
jgi:O-antigen biosynthesis protein WbqP